MKTTLLPTKASNFQALNTDLKTTLSKKGFKLSFADSACARHVAVSDMAYTKRIGYAYSDRPVTVYIYQEGIGVDIDYNQGRNYINSFQKYSQCENFDQAYRKIINFANNYLDEKVSVIG